MMFSVSAFELQYGNNRHSQENQLYIGQFQKSLKWLRAHHKKCLSCPRPIAPKMKDWYVMCIGQFQRTLRLCRAPHKKKFSSPRPTALAKKDWVLLCVGQFQRRLNVQSLRPPKSDIEHENNLVPNSQKHWQRRTKFSLCICQWETNLEPQQHSTRNASAVQGQLHLKRRTLMWCTLVSFKGRWGFAEHHTRKNSALQGQLHLQRRTEFCCALASFKGGWMCKVWGHQNQTLNMKIIWCLTAKSTDKEGLNLACAFVSGKRT